MNINHKWGPRIAAVLGIIVLLAAIATCERGLQKKPVKKLETKRVKALNVDSLNSAIKRQYRDSLDRVEQVYADSLEAQKHHYRYLMAQDRQTEQVYRKAPTLVNCDAVVKSKNQRLAAVEKESKTKDTILKVKDNQIKSHQDELVQKDVTIADLSAGYKKSLELAAKKSRPRRWGLGIQAGYGIAPTESLRPAPYVGAGISYNLVRW